METPEPTPETSTPQPPAPEPPAPDVAAPPADRDLVTLGGLEAEFTELEHELEQVDRPGSVPPGPQAPAS